MTCLLSKYTELTININALVVQKQDHIPAPQNPLGCDLACLSFCTETAVINLICKLLGRGSGPPLEEVKKGMLARFFGKENLRRQFVFRFLLQNDTRNINTNKVKRNPSNILTYIIYWLAGSDVRHAF